MRSEDVDHINEEADKLLTSCQVASEDGITQEQFNRLCLAFCDVLEKEFGWPPQIIPAGTNIGMLLAPLQCMIDRVLDAEGVPRRAWVVAMARRFGMMPMKIDRNLGTATPLPPPELADLDPKRTIN